MEASLHVSGSNGTIHQKKTIQNTQNCQKVGARKDWGGPQLKEADQDIGRSEIVAVASCMMKLCETEPLSPSLLGLGFVQLESSAVQRYMHSRAARLPTI